MSSLLKNKIWLVVTIGALISVVYYRAFLFTPSFNIPLDAAIDEASKFLNYKIPSHKLAENEKPLYSYVFDNGDSALSYSHIESELLFKARHAYWDRDLKTAEETYIQLAELIEAPNIYGELGDVYYMQSKWRKASNVYYLAAIKLKSIDQIDRAFDLLKIISAIDTEVANKLKFKLQHST